MMINLCLLWSVLVYLHPCENSHPSSVMNYIQHFSELNIDSFVFANGFKCSDKHRFENLNNFSVNIFELNSCQDGINCKHNITPIEISKKESDKVIDLLIYIKNIMLLLKNYM